jgi:hypothetical protein
MRLSTATQALLRCSIAGLALGGAPLIGIAQTAPSVTSTSATSAGSNTQPDYHPSMGDLMTMAVQPRHIKLGLAAKQRNWTYAGYELSELRNAFARIARTIPKYQSMDTAEMMAALTNGPLESLDQAIKTSDRKAFGAAYAQLTQACNGCHLSQKHGAVVIKEPDGIMFSDQDFRPVRP